MRIPVGFGAGFSAGVMALAGFINAVANVAARVANLEEATPWSDVALYWGLSTAFLLVRAYGPKAIICTAEDAEA